MEQFNKRCKRGVKIRIDNKKNRVLHASDMFALTRWILTIFLIILIRKGVDRLSLRIGKEEISLFKIPVIHEKYI